MGENTKGENAEEVDVDEIVENLAAKGYSEELIECWREMTTIILCLNSLAPPQTRQ